MFCCKFFQRGKNTDVTAQDRPSGIPVIILLLNANDSCWRVWVSLANELLEWLHCSLNQTSFGWLDFPDVQLGDKWKDGVNNYNKENRKGFTSCTPNTYWHFVFLNFPVLKAQKTVYFILFYLFIYLFFFSLSYLTWEIFVSCYCHCFSRWVEVGRPQLEKSDVLCGLSLTTFESNFDDSR